MTAPVGKSRGADRASVSKATIFAIDSYLSGSYSARRPDRSPGACERCQRIAAAQHVLDLDVFAFAVQSTAARSKQDRRNARRSENRRIGPERHHREPARV